MGGRNFESFGEDPYLTSRMTVSYIKGVQSENVAATVKHYAVNNQEHNRMFIDAIVSERALNEIYFPGFKAAVKEANVSAVMAAYNKLNGFYCSESEFLLKNILKGEWNFQGLVMSDWGAVHSIEPTFKNGLDLEMPEGKYLNKNNLLEKIKNGELSEDELNDKIRRILSVMFRIGLFDKYEYDSTKLNNEEHKNLALDVAKEGIVLLKNEDNILPLDLNKINSIAVIGPTSNVAITGGGGSSMVTPFYSISPLDALQNKVGNKVKINFAQGVILNGTITPIKKEFLFTDKNGKINGLVGEYFTNIEMKGNPSKIRVDSVLDFKWEWDAPFEDFPKDYFSVRWSGYLKIDRSSFYAINVSSDDGIRFYLDDRLVIDDWNDHAELTNSYTTYLQAGIFYKIKLEFYERGGSAICRLGLRDTDTNLISQAIDAAKKSDIAIVFVGTNYTYESEGFDRKDLILPQNQDELIKRIAEANKNTIVVLTTGSPVLMSEWIKNTKAILQTWFAGEQIGNAVAEILLGETNPSGKLPITFPIRWEDCSAYPYYMKDDSITRYDDGIFVGYRHFEKYNIKPLFPFGYGLSYTTFELSDLKLSKSNLSIGDSLKIMLKVKNVGSRKGKEVVQLYVGAKESRIERPIKELKRFQKIELNSGEDEEISFYLTTDDLKYYDELSSSWKVEDGKYQIFIGNSSDNLSLTGFISVGK
jgi:beta-glucosidase